MKSVSKTGKIFEGKLAALMVKVGVAKPLEAEIQEEIIDDVIIADEIIINDVENSKMTAREVSVKIAECSTLEDLKQFESDKRQVVVNAYNKKLKELG